MVPQALSAYRRVASGSDFLYPWWVRGVQTGVQTLLCPETRSHSQSLKRQHRVSKSLRRRCVGTTLPERGKTSKRMSRRSARERRLRRSSSVSSWSCNTSRSQCDSSQGRSSGQSCFSVGASTSGSRQQSCSRGCDSTGGRESILSPVLGPMLGRGCVPCCPTRNWVGWTSSHLRHSRSVIGDVAIHAWRSRWWACVTRRRYRTGGLTASTSVVFGWRCGPVLYRRRRRTGSVTYRAAGRSRRPAVPPQAMVAVGHVVRLGAVPLGPRYSTRADGLAGSSVAVITSLGEG